MEFLQGLVELLLSKDGTIVNKENIVLAIFAAGAAIMGMIIVIFDMCIFYASGKSFLKLRYRGYIIIVHVFAWGLGAGLGGFLAVAADILQITRQACLTAGLSWPLILPRLLETTTIEPEVQMETEEE